MQEMKAPAIGSRDHTHLDEVPQEEADHKSRADHAV